MPSPTLVDVSRSAPMAERKHFWTKGGSVSATGRRDAQNHGETMPGGSFPIRNAADLARAKHDVGRASNPSAARAWINKRAHELGKPALGAAERRYKRMS